jgi:hypothetical protein
MSSTTSKITKKTSENPPTQSYDVKNETNPQIRYLMSYYGY